MSDRGSILISTANDIGEALVEKLGGEGYAPSVWDKEYNKLGIAEVDSAPALSVLEDSSETGTARGSILLSTANAIGAMLNKKYNTDRGFKPKEWASAASKLAPLPEKSAESASICSIEDGADDVPTKSLVVTIPPTISGVSSVSETQTGRNLLNGEDAVKTANNIRFYSSAGKYYLAGTYTLSISENVTGLYIRNVSTSTNIATKYNSNFITFTLTEKTLIGFDFYKVGINQNDNVMLEVGSTASTFEHYTPTTYTTSLGRTIYGGTADIVNGEGTENCTNRNLVGEGFIWSYNATELSFPYFTIGSNAPNKAANKNFVCEGYVNRGNYRSNLQDGEIGVFNNTSGINRFCVRDDSCTTLEQFLEKNANTKITYEVTTPTDFTFTGQEINTRLGYNAFWSDQGNTALDYYGEPEPYTRGTASGAIANVQSARTDLPFTKVKANIAPNFAGVDTVEFTKAGENLVDIENSAEITRNQLNSNVAPIFNAFLQGKTGGYTISGKTVQTVSDDANFISIRINYTDGTQSENVLIYRGDGHSSGGISGDFYIASNTAKTIDVIVFGGNTGTAKCGFENWQLEIGSTATEYTPYEEPTVYTADLGEPVCGGSVDLVSGEVVKDCTKGSMSSSYLSGLNSDYIGYESSTAYFNNHPSIWVRNWNYQTAAPRVSGGIKCACDEFPVSMHNTTIFSAQYRIYFDVYGKNITSVQDFIDYVEDLEQNGKSLDIAYEVATPTESSITPQVISPSTGVNNLWNNAGGDTDVEYFTQE